MKYSMKGYLSLIMADRFGVSPKDYHYTNELFDDANEAILNAHSFAAEREREYGLERLPQMELMNIKQKVYCVQYIEGGIPCDPMVFTDAVKALLAYSKRAAEDMGYRLPLIGETLEEYVTAYTRWFDYHYDNRDDGNIPQEEKDRYPKEPDDDLHYWDLFIND